MDGEFGELGARDWVVDARALGSDVPFFLTRRCALMVGRGDELVREVDAPIMHLAVLWPRPRLASAPERLSRLLRGAGLPRHALRLSWPLRSPCPSARTGAPRH